jgi:hemoglobin-like flavoprotein
LSAGLGGILAPTDAFQREATAMTPEHTRLVKDTWHLVVPIADVAAKLFYDRLFEIDPTTRPLFRAETLAKQRRKLMQVLAVAVQGLDHLDDLVPIVEDLGRRHARYGVTEGHYQSVGTALLWTLEQGLGAAWTPEVKAAWSNVYGLLSGVMQRTATSHATVSVMV